MNFKRLVVVSALLISFNFVAHAQNIPEWNEDWGKEQVYSLPETVSRNIKVNIGNWVADYVNDEFQFRFSCQAYESDSGVENTILNKIYCSVQYKAPDEGGLAFFVFDSEGKVGLVLRNIDDFKSIPLSSGCDVFSDSLVSHASVDAKHSFSNAQAVSMDSVDIKQISCTLRGAADFQVTVSFQPSAENTNPQVASLLKRCVLKYTYSSQRELKAIESPCAKEE